MTAEHVLFIPGVLLVGILIGYTFGARAAHDKITKQKARARE